MYWIKRFFFRIENVFLVFWIITSGFIAVFTYPGSGVDESSHVARAEQISDGCITSQKLNVDDVKNSDIGFRDSFLEDNVYGGYVSSSIEKLSSIITNNLSYEKVKSQKIQFPYWTDYRYSDYNVYSSERELVYFGHTAINSPISYIPYIIAFWIVKVFLLSPILTVITLRLFGVIFFGFIVWFSIRNTPVGKNVMFVCAVLPISLFTNSFVTADLMATAVSFVYISSILRFLYCYSEIKQKDFICLGLSICALALLKMPFIVLGIFIFLIFFVNKMWKNKKHTLILLFSGFLALFLFFLWQYLVKDINPTSYAINITGANAKDQINFIFLHPLSFLKVIFKGLINFNVPFVNSPEFPAWTNKFPLWFLILFYLFTGIIDLVQLPHIKRSTLTSFCFFATSLFIFILLFTALYVTWTMPKSNHIEGIQARYYLPVMVPFMLSIVIFMSKYKNNSQSIQKINTLVPCKTHVLYAVILPLYFIFTMYSVSAIFVF